MEYGFMGCWDDKFACLLVFLMKFCNNYEWNEKLLNPHFLSEPFDQTAKISSPINLLN